jgi:hypothetical protein
MSCRRICRELLWLSRFGELGPSSQPHLDHLVGCRACRDEVGFDREMVRQLRVALAERIEGLQPSPSAWETILARTQTPEPRAASGWWQRSLGLVGRLRTATAMAGTGLALVLALQMEIVPLPATAPSEGADASPTSAASGASDGNRVYGSRAGDGIAARQVTTAKPHPESVLALPLTRPDVPDLHIVPSQPGELVTLDLTPRTAPPPAEPVTSGEESGPAEPETEAQPEPSPAELGVPS